MYAVIAILSGDKFFKQIIILPTKSYFVLSYSPNISIEKTPLTYEGQLARNNVFPFFIAMHEEDWIEGFITTAFNKVCSEWWYNVKMLCKEKVVNYSNAVKNGCRFTMISNNNLEFIHTWQVCGSDINHRLIWIVVRYVQDNVDEEISSFYSWKNIGTPFGSISSFLRFFECLKNNITLNSTN